MTKGIFIRWNSDVRAPVLLVWLKAVSKGKFLFEREFYRLSVKTLARLNTIYWEISKVYK